MISIIRDFFTVKNSFWIGFVAGAIFLWILIKVHHNLPTIIKLFIRIFHWLRDFFSEGVEKRYRADIIRYAQRQHLASPMSSLDEIIIEPQVMVPPIEVSLNNQTLPIDTINLTIPYIPDWPELGATYQTPKMPILTALQSRANVALVGKPGSGKTVTLAYIASQVARKSQESGTLSNLIPILIHSADIDYEPDSKQHSDLLEITAQAISSKISKINLPRLPKLVKSALETNRALILLDGLDELPPDRGKNISQFISAFIKQYPRSQIIVSLSFETLVGLPSMGFHILAMAAWGETEQTGFIHKWGLVWNKLDYQNDSSQLQWKDQQYLSNWLSLPKLPRTPLEMTLIAWGAFAGDLLGYNESSAIEAYLRRMIPAQHKNRDALERLALQMILDMNLVIQPRQIDPIHLNSDLLIGHSGGRYRFINPAIVGYLAGKALTTYTGLSHIQEQPAWNGKSSTLLYYSHFGDASSVIQFLLKNDDFLHRELLRIATWLKVTPPNQPWRVNILRILASVLQVERETLPLAARIITALATSGDPGVVVLFRQMLQSENDNLRLLSALACGITKNAKSTTELTRLLSDKSPSIVRAACLALVAIGDKHALEVVAHTLLGGTEVMRKAAAEALANHPQEGYPTLQDGSTHKDIRVRHSIVYGLKRIKQPWAKEILRQMQLEEKEWIVRNAAIQVMEELAQPDFNIPQTLPDLAETPWLIDYAAKQGMGVSPGKPAFDLVLDAVKKGNTTERLLALSYLGMFGDEQSIPIIYSWYFGSSGEIRNAAYQTLWWLASSGVSLPPPGQFGFDK